MAVDAARAKSLFLTASDLTDQAERAAYLERECGDDAALRQRVEALLAADDGGRRAVEGDATATSEPTSPATLEATAAFDAETHLPSELATAADRSDGADFTITGAPRGERPGGSSVGKVIAGRYTLLELLGEGGMGTVYRAGQTAPVRRQVALKLIKIGMDSRAVLARFDAERQALALMDHPNIARVYDGGETESGQPFFVMELVSGEPITDYCDRKRLPVPARLELFVAVCQAVQHAHQKGIIHRDLKPGNVLVTDVDGRRHRRSSTSASPRRWRSSSPNRAWATPERLSARRRICRPSRLTRRRWTRSGRMSEAEAEFRAALTIRRGLADASPAVPRHRNNLAYNRRNFGDFLMRSGRTSEAEAEFRAALTIWRGLADANPDRRGFLASGHEALGDLLIRTGRTSEAEAEFRAALAIRQKAADASPTGIDPQHDLASSLSRLGQVEQRRGRIPEAVASFRNAIAVLERIPRVPNSCLYDLACYQALLGGASASRAEADRAMDSLRRSVALRGGDLGRMRTDTGLDPLRDRDDFRLFMLDLAFPADPFASGR